MRRTISARLVTVLGCGGGTEGPDTPPDAAECTALGTCVWLDEYQHRIVSDLAGETEVTPGVRLMHRASVSERDAARTYLLAELTALGYAPVRHGYTTGGNVVATLDSTTGGTGLIVVGAHFDRARRCEVSARASGSHAALSQGNGHVRDGLVRAPRDGHAPRARGARDRRNLSLIM